MAKRRIPKKPVRTVRHKTVGQYIKIYFLTLIIGVLVFVGESFIFQPKPPCANSGTCTTDLTEKVENGAVGTFEGHTVKAPPVTLASDNRRQNVLGANVPAEEKHIYVDLSTQIVYAYE